MRILQLHNRYASSASGGEDSVVQQEHDLLASHGEEVTQLFATNVGLPRPPRAAAVMTAFRSIWSQAAYREVRAAIVRIRPDVIHVHNTFAALSPSVFWAARAERVASVMTLHNYRLVCASTVLMRDGTPCEKCVGRLPLPALRHRCRYVDSSAVGMSIAAGQVAHGVVGTYRNQVDAFIALTGFARDVFERSGLPREKLHVKPNFVPHPDDDGGEPDLRFGQRQLAFVGLVDHVKGVDLLTDASSECRVRHKLVLVGDGRARAELERRTAQHPHIQWAGRLPRAGARALIAASSWLVVPSRWYEGGLPLVVLEALRAGRPVIVPELGVFPGLVAANENALFFTPNDATSLRHALQRALTMGDAEWRAFSSSATRLCRERYMPEANYRQLMGVYRAAVRAAAGRCDPGRA